MVCSQLVPNGAARRWPTPNTTPTPGEKCTGEFDLCVEPVQVCCDDLTCYRNDAVGANTCQDCTAEDDE